MMGISQSNQSLSRILIPCNIYFQMPHLFATFFTFKVFAVLSALCQAGQWWGTEQRGICPGGCARAFLGELIFNTARFVGGQPTGTATYGEHWENWDCGCGPRQAGALYLPTCSAGSCGFVEHFGKSPFGGCSTHLIQMHLQEMHFQGHSCCFPLLRSRAVLQERQQQQLSVLISFPFSPNEAASSISTPSPSGSAMPSR